jgi:hypothetical protein
MNLGAWLQRLAPDYVATARRFPFAIVLAAAMTVVALFVINPPTGYIDGFEPWFRLAAGLATGAVLAVAGVYFEESRPEARVGAVLLKYVLPLAVVGVFQVTGSFWIFPWLLPAVSILWLSVSPFTWAGRGPERETQQNLFWWVNHQAVATAAIAAAAFAIIAVGLLAIERSLTLLFNLDASQIFYRWVLPVTGLFLTPVYWLSTLPRVANLQASEAENPDFTSQAIGFLGQFVLVPLLLIYAAILLAYTGQIAITQQLPQGTIGWMVLGFVVTGAGTWLVLHPPFMRKKPLVRLFRRVWFWLTLIPLVLFFFAVWVRVDAYGLTAERILLLAGGVWAVLLAAIFLARRGDIRLIPALAGAILLVLSLGPWNILHLPTSQQLMRLDALVMNAGADKSASPPRADWSAEEVAEARGIIDYLVGTREGREGTRELMGKYGVTWDAGQDGSYAVLEALGVSVPSTEGEPRFATLFRNFDGSAVDTSAFPFLIRPVGLYGNSGIDLPPLRFWTGNGELRVGPAISPDADLVPLPLGPWLERQTGGFVVEPWLDFSVAGRNYRLVVQSLTIDRGENNAGPPLLSSLEAQLFSDVGE